MRPLRTKPNTITPAGFQAAPRKPGGRSQIVCAGPPVTSILLSLAGKPAATNPICRLSGDQKGEPKAAKPRGLVSLAPNDRIHKRIPPSKLRLVNARCRPSGETLRVVTTVFSG